MLRCSAYVETYKIIQACERYHIVFNHNFGGIFPPNVSSSVLQLRIQTVFIIFVCRR